MYVHIYVFNINLFEYNKFIKSPLTFTRPQLEHCDKYEQDMKSKSECVSIINVIDINTVGPLLSDHLGGVMVRPHN